MSKILDIIIENGLSYTIIFIISSVISSYLINKSFNDLFNTTLLVNCLIFVSCNILIDLIKEYLLNKKTFFKDKNLDNFTKNFISTLILFTCIHIFTALYNKNKIFTKNWYRLILLILLVSSFTNIFSQILKVLIKNKYSDLIINIINKIITLLVLDYIPDIELNTFIQDSIGYTIGKSVEYVLTSTY